VTGERTAVYRCYDVAGILLYVGVSNDIGFRWRQHALDKPWWPQVQRQTVDWYGSRPEALAAEMAAIIADKPVHNIRYNGSQDDNGDAAPSARRSAERRELSLTLADLLTLSDARRACAAGAAREMRESAGLTQDEIAEIVGVTRAAVSQWERGQRVPAGNAALAYGRLLRQYARRAA
jgi:DNA-binding transcriptional regulator YiaG